MVEAIKAVAESGVELSVEEGNIHTSRIPLLDCVAAALSFNYDNPADLRHLVALWGRGRMIMAREMKMKGNDGEEALRKTFRVSVNDIDGSITKAKTDVILNKFIRIRYYFPRYQNK